MRIFTNIALLSGVSLFGLSSSSSLFDMSRYPSGLSPQQIPNDQSYGAQSSLNTVNIAQAWDVTTGSSEVIIAIIDDAIDVNHPDLKDNMLPGWDFVNGDNDPSPGPCYDPATQIAIEETHGTSVAGIIGAVGNNNMGIAGINWQVKILPLKIGCSFPKSLETAAVQFAIQQGAHIINASYAGPEFINGNVDVIELLQQAKNQVLFVTSAGNHHTNNDISPMYPSNVSLPNVITVTSSNANNQLSHWSQYGVSSVSIAAPGENLLTTLYDEGTENDYGTVSGTSFSTAVVSGIAGLVKSIDLQNGVQNLSPADLKGVLLASGTPLNAEKGMLQSDAIVNANNAVNLAKNALSEKKPTVIIDDILIEDSEVLNANGIVDPLEEFTIKLDLMSHWDDLMNASLEVRPINGIIQPVENQKFIDFWVKNTSQTFRFSFRSSDFTGHQSFPMTLVLNATSTNGNAFQQERTFKLESGLLQHNIPVNDAIQKHLSDEMRLWHLNIPAEANKVAIELERNVIDSRRLGLLVGMQDFPKVYFNSGGGRDYLSVTEFNKVQMYSDKSFERVDFDIASLKRVSMKFLVFNKPLENASADGTSNKNYRIRACYFTDNDSNKAPVVDAGSSMRVNAGEKVEITGSASDIDGEIRRIWWSTSSNVSFNQESATKISFTAPQTGTASFTLSAIDDDCHKSTDTVVISVVDEDSGDLGLQINPKRIEIEEGSSISVQVSANYQNIPVSDLVFVSGPDGLVFEKSINQDSFDRLIWQNTPRPGVYAVIFSANVDGSKFEGQIIIEIKKRGSKKSGGGCSIRKNNEFDPVLILCLAFSSMILLKRCQKTNVF